MAQIQEPIHKTIQNQNVVQNHVITTSSQSITAGVRTDIVGLTASITPRSADSRIKVTVRWNGEGDNVNNYDTVFGIRRDGIDIGNPASAGIRQVGISIIAQGYFSANVNTTPDSATYSYIDSPNSTSELVYTASFLAKEAQILYNNRTVSDDNNDVRERLTSSITLEEIGAEL